MASAKPIALYTDFNCPYCYVLNERIVEAGLEDEFTWRGIELDATLAVPMAPAPPPLALELDRDLMVLRERAPACRVDRPMGKPNTRLATLWSARAQQIDPLRARVFRRALYHALWTQGRDLADEMVLDVLRRFADLPALEPDASTQRRVEGWQHSWFANVRLVPAMLARTGERFIGLPSTEELSRFVSRVRDRAG